MADVSPDDRAQLVIIGGLALAVTLVALAIILNSAIYTGNLATRESSIDASTVISDQHTVNESLGRAVRYANTRNPSATNDNFSEEVTVLNDRLRKQTRNGVIMHVNASVSEEGTRIAQLNESRDFTAGGMNDGTEEWTLIDSTQSTRLFRMRLNKSSLFNADFGDGSSTISNKAFNVKVTNESGTGTTWNVYIYQSDITGNAYLITDEPSGGFSGLSGILEILDGSCAATGPEVVVDFKQGEFGPAPDPESEVGVFPVLSSDVTSCSELSWYDATEDYTIRYENTYSDWLAISGENPTVKGKYELITTGTLDGSLDDNYHDAASGKSPFNHTAITSVDAQMSYRTSEVTYSTSWTQQSRQQRVFTGVAPVIQQFTVNDQADGDFEIDWEVSDADEDLREVTVTLYDTSNNEIDDNKTYSVSGSSADDQNLVLDGNSDSDNYEVRIRVRDSQGHVTFEEIENP